MRWFRGLVLVLFLWALLACFALAWGEDRGVGGNAEALMRWKAALTEFRRAGSLIGEGNYEEAMAFLMDVSRRLPSPYSRMAQAYGREISYPLKRRGLLGGYYVFGRLGRLCVLLGAYQEASDLLAKAKKAHPEDHYDYGLLCGWCLAEAGKDNEALAEYRRRLEEARASDWKRYFQEQIELIRQRRARWHSPEFVLRYVRRRYWEAYDAPKNYLGALEHLHGALPHADTPMQKLSLYRAIIRCLDGLSDEAGRTAWEERVLEEFKDDCEVSASVLVARAQRAYEDGKLAEALQLYREVSRKYPDSGSYGVAQYNVGIILKRQQKYEEAIRAFSELLRSNVDELEPGAHIMETYRNYRSRAQWQIAMCRLAQKEYSAALAALKERRENYPLESWCGTCQAHDQYKQALYEGLCYEHLGRYKDAVACYFRAIKAHPAGPAPQVRLVELYTAAGQLKDLLALAERQLREIPEVNRGKEPVAQQAPQQHSPVPEVMRRVIEFRQWEAAGEWAKLVAQLRARRTVAGPQEQYAQRENWEAVEAARILARHPDQAVPLLIEALPKTQGADQKWLYYALGLCGTQKAVEVLKAAALKKENYASAVYALGLAGEAGANALQALEARATKNLKIAIQRWKQGQLGQTEEPMPFPAIPKDISLPRKLRRRFLLPVW